MVWDARACQVSLGLAAGCALRKLEEPGALAALCTPEVLPPSASESWDEVLAPTCGASTSYLDLDVATYLPAGLLV